MAEEPSKGKAHGLAGSQQPVGRGQSIGPGFILALYPPFALGTGEPILEAGSWGVGSEGVSGFVT